MSSRSVRKQPGPRVNTQRRIVAVCVLLAASVTDVAHAEPPQTASCRETVLAGRVEQGQTFEAAVAANLVFRLVPEIHPNNPSGWTIQITPAGDPDADYLMVATPPYRFSNPRYVDTGYGMTAAAALSWTPREFAFVAEAQDYETATESLGVLLWPGSRTQAEVERAQTALDEVPTYRGLFWIEDGATAPPDDRRPQGDIDWITFRVELCVPEMSGQHR